MSIRAHPSLPLFTAEELSTARAVRISQPPTHARAPQMSHYMHLQRVLADRG